jgi:protein-disulfide isomerase
MQVEPQLIANYVVQGKLRLAFHHVLDHGNSSRLAHLAAECAGAQNPLAFWQMHNLLFVRQGELWGADATNFVQWASELGLDGATLQSCLGDPAIAEKVTRLDQSRRDQGLRTRPSFVINDQTIQGAAPYATFAQVLDQLLAQ